METIVKQLEGEIRAGKYAADRRFLSERSLAKRFNVSLGVARQILNRLGELGLVYRVARGGTFVNLEPRLRVMQPAELPLACINFVEDLSVCSDPFSGPFSFVLSDYLTGYTRCLQQHSLRVRFVNMYRMVPDEFPAALNPDLPAVDQACVIGEGFSPALMQWLRDRDVPFVLRRFAFYDHRDYPPHHGVYLNRSAAAFAATRHLMQLGHQRIGYIGRTNGRLDDDMPRLERCLHADGYRAAFCVAGHMPPQDLQVHVEGVRRVAIQQAAERLLDRADRPTAVVCCNDLTAFIVMKTAASMGLSIPRDLSVTGFDNDPAGLESDPPLTTFSGHADLANAAVERLLAVFRDPKIPFEVQPVECSMVMRGSTAAPLR